MPKQNFGKNGFSQNVSGSCQMFYELFPFYGSIELPKVGR